MNFIFLGPGETGSWDAWLFWTQLFLAIAAVASPFIAHCLSSRRERRASKQADRRMEAANEAAIAREELAHERARQRSIGERRSYSRAIFHAVQAEADQLEHRLNRAWDFWNQAAPSRHVADEYLVQLPSVLSKPEVWTRIVIPEHLDSVVEVLRLVHKYNQAVEKASGDAVTPVSNGTVAEIVEILKAAMKANAGVMLTQPAREPRDP